MNGFSRNGAHLKLRIPTGRLFALALVVLLVSGGTAFASIIGSVKGTVIDQGTGEPIIAAQVVVESDNIRNNGAGAYTDAEGQFQINNLVAGQIRLRILAFGYTERVITLDIVPGVAQERSINLVQEGEVEIVTEEVIDPGSGPIITEDKPWRNYTISQTEVEDIPHGGSFQSVLTDMVAGVTQDADGGIHVQGGRDGEISWNIDGFNVTDPVTGTFGTNLNLNAIEHMEISTGGFSAEFGQAMSAVVNVITKSGGNEFHGGLEFIYQNHELTDAIFGESDTYRKYNYERPGLFEPIVPVDPDNFEEVPRLQHYRFAPEFFLEGPIVRDKLTFFAGFDFITYEREQYFERSPRTWEGFNANGKLTYKVTPDDSLVLSFTKSKAEIGINQREFPESANPSQTQDTGNYNLQYSHNFDERTNIQVNFQYMDMFLRVSPTDQPGKSLPWEFATILAPNRADPIWDELRRTINPDIRGPEDLDNDDVYLSGDYFRHYQRNTFNTRIGTKVATVLGRGHRLSVGVEFGDVYYKDQSVWNGYKQYLYIGSDPERGGGWLFDETSSTTPYTGDGNPLTHSGSRLGLPGYYELRREAPYPGFGEPTSEFHKVNTRMQNYSMYVNDTWNPLSTLTVNVGLRADILDVNLPRNIARPDYPDIPSQFGTGGVAEPANPIGGVNGGDVRRRNDFTSVDISPRLSMSYSPEPSFNIFANYGIFYNATQLFYAALTDETSAYQYRFYGEWDRYVWNSYSPSEMRSEKTYFYQLGFDKGFGDLQIWGLSMTASWKQQDDLYSNLELTDYQGTSEFRTVRNIGDAEYWGADIIFRRRLHNYWMARLSYTYSQAIGTLDYIDYLSFADNQETPNVGEFFPLDWDVPHVVKGSFLFEVPQVKGLEFSAVFSYESGVPYTDFYRTILNGSFSTIYTDAKNAQRLPDRSNVNLTAAYDWSFGDGGQYTLRTWLTFYNLFNSYNVLEAQDGGGAAIEVARRRFVEIGMRYRF